MKWGIHFATVRVSLYIVIILYVRNYFEPCVCENEVSVLLISSVHHYIGFDCQLEFSVPTVGSPETTS